MATNFEFYKNRLKKNFGRWNTETCDVEAIEKAIGFKICEGCHEAGCSECILNAIEWLSSEHIEQPKLTKRERAFCEAVQRGWIARDCDMTLCYFECKPVFKSGSSNTEGHYVYLQALGLNDDFMFIKDTDAEPWAVEDLLNLDVIEEETANNKKCSSYHVDNITPYCSGTKECDPCSCEGDKSKCDFYPENRKNVQEDA